MHININIDPNDNVYNPLHRAAILLLRGGEIADSYAVLRWIAADLDRITALIAKAIEPLDAEIGRLNRLVGAAERDQIDKIAGLTEYDLPLPPVVGTQLRDRYGYGWRVGLAAWESPGPVPRALYRAPELDNDPDPLHEPNPGEELYWTGYIFDERRGFEVIPQDPEDARLYGPIGERWGDPTQPCPYTGCVLKLGHIGPHVDAGDQDISPTDSDPIKGHNPVPCTCRQPANHQPGCPRFVLARGAIDPTQSITRTVPAPFIGAAAESLAASLEAVADSADTVLDAQDQSEH